MPIRIARGQRKTVLMEYFQGDETTPPIDLTNALFSVDDANFPASIIFEEVDLPAGKVNIVITNEASAAMRPKAVNWFTVKVQIRNWEDVSEPIEFEVTAA